MSQGSGLYHTTALRHLFLAGLSCGRLPFKCMWSPLNYWCGTKTFALRPLKWNASPSPSIVWLAEVVPSATWRFLRVFLFCDMRWLLLRRRSFRPLAFLGSVSYSWNTMPLFSSEIFLAPCVFKEAFLIRDMRCLLLRWRSFGPLAFLRERFLFVKRDASFFIRGLFSPLHF
jgi:hypothetical protein